jgi:uncharacterized membrane protein (Fun14 family)
MSLFRAQFAIHRVATAAALVTGSTVAVHMHRRDVAVQAQTSTATGTPAQPPKPASVSTETTTVNSATNQHVRRAGLGALLGFASGYAVKKIGRLFLLVLGLEFLFLQSLVVMDLITVHWDRVGRRTTALTTADGQRNTESRLVTLLTTNIPFKASFLGAFYGGFRFG